ncbi:MetQ/NlpA family ABC transporter substrate-binding protein, partial [Serratia sp. ME47]|uniref:MetQ/NlpA family ABC transporter substrate-binding protein n=1 Tax=Serratia sp. ME47 TaxID=2744257 RepID=UPI00210715AD
MKKHLLMLAFASVATLASYGAAAATKLVVGASNVPHAEILEQAKPILAKEGIDLQIKRFQDYILPNTALASHDIDANYFQHVPYRRTNRAQDYARLFGGRQNGRPTSVRQRGRRHAYFHHDGR